MTNTVSIDSMIFVWGVKKAPTVGQEEKIALAENLLDYLDNEGRQIVIATPVITEIMCPIPEIEKRNALLDIIQTRFRVAPLDDLAAYIAGDIWSKHKNDWKDIYNAGGNQE